MFYPDNPEELRALVEGLLEGRTILDKKAIKALIVPHAGYVYSGQTAATAFREVKNGPWKRVVVISPSHREAFQGVSAYPGEAYATPLGEIEVDREFCGMLADHSRVVHISDRGHSLPGGRGMGEHALEVQLPFLQCVLEGFSLVPLVMGKQDMNTAAELGRALADLCRDGRTLIVASSDLSHFHSYDQAREKDLKLVEAIRGFDYFSLASLLDYGEVEACGSGPVMAAMIAAERLGAEGSRILDYRNSGDVEFGTRDQVVGYTSAALLEAGAERENLDVSELSLDEQDFLLRLARNSVESAVKKQDLAPADEHVPEKFQQKAAVFVTLTVNGNLRGCIGSIIPQSGLYDAVSTSAVNAALHDPRFSPVVEIDLPGLSYEVSVLSRFRLMAETEEIIIGKHGLLIQSGHRSGLLLPQVASEYSWDTETFLKQTCIKASLSPDSWKDPSSDVFYFSAMVFNDHQS